MSLSQILYHVIEHSILVERLKLNTNSNYAVKPNSASRQYITTYLHIHVHHEAMRVFALYTINRIIYTNHNSVKRTTQYNTEICHNLFPCRAAMTPAASAQNASEWCRKSELVSIIQGHQLTASVWVRENLHLRVQLYWDVRYVCLPIPVATQSKTWVCGRSPAEIVCSNTAESWKFVCCECCVFSGRGLWDELITRPEKSYRLWCVVVCDMATSWIRRP
jgi:hypothetical protein